MATEPHFDPSDWLTSNAYAFAVRDPEPVTPGHSLVVPRGELVSWWDATASEQLAMFELLGELRTRIEAEFSPAGFTVGFDDGDSSGRAFDRFCLHLIPRYGGSDDPEPRGLRSLATSASAPAWPAQARHEPGLITPQGGLHLELVRAFLRPDLDRVDLLVSFIMRSGLNLILEKLDDALDHSKRVRILTTDYLCITEPSAIGALLDRVDGENDLEVRVFSDPSLSFHPKAYIFSSSVDDGGLAIVGSSNLSRSGIAEGVEWNLETAQLAGIHRDFASLWADERSLVADADWLRSYEKRWKDRRSAEPKTAPAADRDEAEPAIHLPVLPSEPESQLDEPQPSPWPVQAEALSALEATRIEHFEAGLVVMATGLGKTWLAAFDTTRPSFKRVLFIAHREEILKQARDIFRQLRPSGTLTLFGGEGRDASGDVVFAGVQLLSRRLSDFEPDDFDYIVVDEFHHAAAPTYRKVISHFRPKFLLGLTATPNRADSADLLALCADNLVYECDMTAGIRHGLLSPFRYRAITDSADYEHIPWRSGRFDPEELTNQFATEQRAQQVYDEWLASNGPDSRTIGFCASVRHADFMAEFFRTQGVRALAVHSGPTSSDRQNSLLNLEEGTTPVVFTVDLFNEGVDVPKIDLILMLRPTESDIVFTQQLGRGLRRADGKARLEVIDLVGNHRSFLRKARLLAALAGRSNQTQRETVEFLGAERDALAEGAILPEGCSIILEPEVIDLLASMIGRPTNEDRLVSLIREWWEEHGEVRPRALELAALTQRALSLKKDGWFGLLDQLGLLSNDESNTLSASQGLFSFIERTNHATSFALVCLQSLVQLDGLTEPLAAEQIAQVSRWRIFRDSTLRADLSEFADRFVDPLRPTQAEWLSFWDDEVLASLTERRRGSQPLFTFDGELLVPNLSSTGPALNDMVEELVDYHLWRYVSRKTARVDSHSRKPVANGQEIDATFLVEASESVASSIVIESAGGTRGTKTARNLDYVTGFDHVLRRLAELDVMLADVHIDTTASKHLSVAERRLSPGEGRRYPIRLSGEADLVGLRRELLRSMAHVGRGPRASGSGNQRRRTRLVISNTNGLTAEELATTVAEPAKGPAASIS